MKAMRWTAPFLIILLAATHIGAQTPDARSALVGCITDPAGQPLPGVTVDVSSGSVHRSVFSNAAGCYELTDLLGGSYVVFARLPGFVSFTRDQLNVLAGRVEQLNVQMPVATICECIELSTLASLWKEVDAVVRLRITGHEPGPAPAYVKHTAAVLNVWKQHPTGGPSAMTVNFFQIQMYDETEPYAIGQEFVMFLRWQSTQDGFVRFQTGRGAAAFLIQDGLIYSAGIAGYVGTRLDDYLAELRGLSTAR
jgi:hypothetical protein